MAVVTTAALGAGVDFPASQVIFDALAMGRDWLSVQEFNQMAGPGRAAGFPRPRPRGAPRGTRGSYSREHPGTEEEIALRLLKGQMEEVAPVHDLEQSSEEYVANAVACGGEEADLARINATMVGSMEPVLPELVAHRLVQKKGTTIELSPLARVMSEHFIGIERLLEIVESAQKMDDPLDIIAELESEGMEKEAAQKKERGGSHQGGKKGHGRR